MNSQDSETSGPHKLLINLTDKIGLIRKDKYIALLNLSIYQTWKDFKKSYKMKNLKKNLNYLMDHILYQTFKIIWNTYQKSMVKKQLIVQQEHI